MTIIVYDPEGVRAQLLPITFTRPSGAIRMGALTMAERWQACLPGDYFWQSSDYLAEMFPRAPHPDDSALYVAGNVIATDEIARASESLAPGQLLAKDGLEIGRRGLNTVEKIEYPGDVTFISHIYDVFTKNHIACRVDFDRLTSGRTSAPIDPTNTVLGNPAEIFIEPGAMVEASTLNTRQGPIYIGRDAIVMEGCHLRGPLMMCEHSQANMGTLLYGATTLGPHCKVGGEINNVVMLGYSNKGHDGFLGNAVIGEWCNLGAGTQSSNLKNDYTEIKLWNYPAGRFLRTGLQFCGLIMGDHSKSAINTSFNTATVIGVGCNIVSEGMPRVFTPSFSKGGTSGYDDVNLNEFFAVATRVMARRGHELTEAHRHLFQAIFDYADKFK